MRARIALAGAATVVAVTFGLAQGVLSQAPVRDQGRVAFSGTATIAGMVVADDEKRTPLVQAPVTLRREGMEDMRVTSTDEQGRYQFTELPSGTFTLSARKGGYIGMEYGAPRAGQPGIVIALAEGQQFAAKAIPLLRGAVIAGRLTDHLGRPYGRMQVRVAQIVTVGGVPQVRQTPGSNGSTFTDDHGEYRVFGLLPGSYIVGAVPPGSASLPAPPTEAELKWAKQPSGPPPPGGRATTFAQTLFPGTTDPSAATVVDLGRGEERLGVDFTLRLVPVASIRGVVLGPDGRPAPGAQVRRTAGLPPFGETDLIGARTLPDGSFVMDGVTPGQHTLVVGSSADLARSESLVARGLANPVPAGTAMLWAQERIVVAGADVSGVTLRLREGFTVTGQIVIQGDSPAPWPTTALRVQLPPSNRVSLAMSVAFGSSASATVDGSFTLAGVIPGSYRLRVTSPNAPGTPWAPKSAMLDGRDLIDIPLDIDRSISGVAVTMTNTWAELSGTLTDSVGQPAPQLYVMLFSTNKAHWFNGTRWVRNVRATDAGTYQIRTLPAGEYYLCALTEIDLQLFQEREYLEQLVSSSIKVVVGDTEKKTQHLRVGR
jgi:hypothetical protein